MMFSRWRPTSAPGVWSQCHPNHKAGIGRSHFLKEIWNASVRRRGGCWALNHWWPLHSSWALTKASRSGVAPGVTGLTSSGCFEKHPILHTYQSKAHRKQMSRKLGPWPQVTYNLVNEYMFSLWKKEKKRIHMTRYFLFWNSTLNDPATFLK